MWPRGFSILIFIIELSVTKGIFILDLWRRNCLQPRGFWTSILTKGNCLWPQSWRRNYLWPRSWSWRRKCLQPKDLDLDEGDVCNQGTLILTKEMSATSILILNMELSVTLILILRKEMSVTSILILTKEMSATKGPWSWRSKCLQPRSWFWWRNFLRPRSWSWQRVIEGLLNLETELLPAKVKIWN